MYFHNDIMSVGSSKSSLHKATQTVVLVGSPSSTFQTYIRNGSSRTSDDLDAIPARVMKIAHVRFDKMLTVFKMHCTKEHNSFWWRLMDSFFFFFGRGCGGRV